ARDRYSLRGSEVIRTIFDGENPVRAASSRTLIPLRAIRSECMGGLLDYRTQRITVRLLACAPRASALVAACGLDGGEGGLVDGWAVAPHARLGGDPAVDAGGDVVGLVGR